VVTSLQGWPFTERRVTVNGHEMAYVDEGTGPVVLLVHGNPTWGFYYRRLMASLAAAGVRAIAPDHIGMGRSEKPSAADYPHTLRRRVLDLGAFIDALALDRPLSIVAHDWGGAIALAWAVDNADRVDKLVLFNTGAFPLPPEKSLPWSLRAARLPVVGEFAVRRLNAFSRGALVMGSGKRWLPAEARRGLLDPYDRPAHRVAVHRFVKDIPLRPSDPAYEVLAHTEKCLPLLHSKPTMMFWGMKDPVFDEVVLDHLVELMPQAEVHRFDDAGHYVLEDAADRIVPPVTRFLSS
jgi:pimeloyl-ACP methyl ester carboxylesterase